MHLIGVDVGGTFTDIVCFDRRTSRYRVAKVPSFPGEQWKGIVAALDGLGMLASASEPLRLGEISRSANFALFAPWTVSMLATTL